MLSYKKKNVSRRALTYERAHPLAIPAAREHTDERFILALVEK